MTFISAAKALLAFNFVDKAIHLKVNRVDVVCYQSHLDAKPAVEKSILLSVSKIFIDDPSINLSKVITYAIYHYSHSLNCASAQKYKIEFLTFIINTHYYLSEAHWGAVLTQKAISESPTSLVAQYQAIDTD